VPHSQRYLFNAILDTNHNANPTNPNRNSKGNPANDTNSTNPNTRYRCEYGTLNSMLAQITFTVEAAPHGPILSADIVVRYFDIIF